jgi:hypothetical protein
VAKPLPKKELERVEKATDEVMRHHMNFSDARQERLAAMRAAREAGASLAAIGKAAGGISRQRVAEILGER